MAAQNDFAEPLLKHLDFIQAVIARQASNSFLIKGWAITVAGIVFGFAARNLNWRIALVGLLPALGFWGLDAYYLRQERLFRCLYDAVRTGDPAIDPFCMNPSEHDLTTKTVLRIAVTRSLWPIYSIIVAVGLVVIIAGWYHSH